MAVEIASGTWELPRCRLVILVWLWGGGVSQKGVREVMLGVCVVLVVFFPLLGLQAGTGAAFPSGIAPGGGLEEFCVGACSSWRSRIQAGNGGKIKLKSREGGKKAFQAS